MRALGPEGGRGGTLWGEGGSSRKHGSTGERKFDRGSWRVLARFLAGRSLIGKPQIDDGLARVDLRLRASHSHILTLSLTHTDRALRASACLTNRQTVFCRSVDK